LTASDQESNDLRIRIDLVQETTTILPVEHAGEAPRLFLHRLDVLDLDEQDITRLSRFDLEGASQIVDLGQVDVAHVFSAVVVLDLSASPVDTLDLDHLSILDAASERDWEGSATADVTKML